MSDNYTDKQRMEIAEQEYNSYKESDGSYVKIWDKRVRTN